MDEPRICHEIGIPWGISLPDVQQHDVTVLTALLKPTQATTCGHAVALEVDPGGGSDLWEKDSHHKSLLNKSVGVLCDKFVVLRSVVLVRDTVPVLPLVLYHVLPQLPDQGRDPAST